MYRVHGASLGILCGPLRGELIRDLLIDCEDGTARQTGGKVVAAMLDGGLRATGVAIMAGRLGTVARNGGRNEVAPSGRRKRSATQRVDVVVDIILNVGGRDFVDLDLLANEGTNE